ncbi:hypothetical protein COEX109129_42170 [Corallococcus exiguus]
MLKGVVSGNSTLSATGATCGGVMPWPGYGGSASCGGADSSTGTSSWKGSMPLTSVTSDDGGAGVGGGTGASGLGAMAAPPKMGGREGCDSTGACAGWAANGLGAGARAADDQGEPGPQVLEALRPSVSTRLQSSSRLRRA